MFWTGEMGVFRFYLLFFAFAGVISSRSCSLRPNSSSLAMSSRSLSIPFRACRTAA